MSHCDASRLGSARWARPKWRRVRGGTERSAVRCDIHHVLFGDVGHSKRSALRGGAMRDRGSVEAIHRALLEKWRNAMDLVGPGPLDVHFEDSRAGVEGLGATGRWADLG